MDYYRTLGIRRDATADEIKAAFRALALKFHPDRHVTSDPAAQDKAGTRFKEVSEAYQVLSNDAKRAVYNREGRAGLRYGGAPGYQQYARYRGASRSYTGYDQSYRTREMSPEEAAARLRFYFKLARIQTFITLLGIGAFLFIDQAGESMWKRHNAGKSFEDLQAARQAQPNFPDPKPSVETGTNHRPARPPAQLLVRRPNPGWPFHHRRQRDVVSEPRTASAANEEAPRGTEGQRGESKGGNGAGGDLRKPSEGGGLDTRSAPRLGDAVAGPINLIGASSSSQSVGAEALSKDSARAGVVNRGVIQGAVEQQSLASTSPSRGSASGLDQPQTEGT